MNAKFQESEEKVVTRRVKGGRPKRDFTLRDIARDVRRGYDHFWAIRGMKPSDSYVNLERNVDLERNE